MAHQRALERDAANPLAAGLDDVLRSILHLNRAALVDGHDVAGLEPPVVGEPVRAVGTVVVRARNPWSPDFELAHRLAVPGDERALIAARADLDERRRPSLFRAVLEA